MDAGRSRRSHIVEIALTAAVVVAIYLFLANDDPQWFGQLFAAYMQR